MNVERLLFLLPLLPFLGFLGIGLLGSRIPRRLVGPLGCAAPALGFLIALQGFLQVRAEGAPALLDRLYTWMQVGTVGIEMAFRLDRLSAVLVLVVTGVGLLIHIYSIGYMREDPGYPRFFAYLNLFTAAMLVLALADNLVLLFLGWEGVGLASYLLIGFWFDEVENAAAGRKAFVVNRIGDFAFILGIFLAFSQFGSFRLQELVDEGKLASLRQSSPALLTAIALLFFGGATGKSAQVPLYVWLPDAMAGPTPVSALIHAATMVTSGVYLVARLGPLYASAPGALAVVAGIGGITALLAGFIALTQFDIKRVLAYSTVSQLGYMFIALGLGLPAVAMFHLVTHAFFKALLFLGAGAVIHSLHHQQDLRRMGGLARSLPRTFLIFLAGSFAITGFPLFSGFFSKEAILHGATERAFGPEGGPGWVLLWLAAVVTTALTAFYTFRLVALAFLGKERWREPALSGPDHGAPGSPHAPDRLHEAPPVMLAPLYLLMVLSIFGGWFDVPGFLSGSRPAHPAWIGPLVFFLSMVAFAGGLWAAWQLYLRAPESRARLMAAHPAIRGVLRLSSRKLYLDEIYDALVVKPFQALSYALFTIADRILIDLLLVEGTAGVARGFGGLFRKLQSGRVPAYAAWFMVGAVAVLAAVALRGGLGW